MGGLEIDGPLFSLDPNDARQFAVTNCVLAYSRFLSLIMPNFLQNPTHKDVLADEMDDV